MKGINLLSTHYTITVIGKKIEEQLQPFDKSNVVESHVLFTREEKLKERKLIVNGCTKIIKDRLKLGPLDTNIEFMKEQLEYFKNIKNEEFWSQETNKYELNSDGFPIATHNSKGKWSWYSVCGKHKNILIKKDGTRSDSVKKKDIDWEAHKDFCTFAFLKNGKWDEYGKLSWCGIVFYPQRQWLKIFKSLLDSVKDNEIITIVDARI